MRTNGCAAVCSIRAAGSHNSLQNIWRFAPFFFILQTIMILVFGGTTEGRKAVQVLEEAGTTYYYSTRGSAQEVEMVHGQRLQGAMEVADITKFCRDGGIRLLVDAAHPFAVNVHRNILSAAEELQIPVVRYERQYVPHTDDITWCDDYDDAVTSLRQAGITRLLALTGVQTIGKLKARGNEQQKFDKLFDMEVRYFEGIATFVQKIKFTKEKYLIDCYLEYGACNDEMCMPPSSVEFKKSGTANIKQEKEEGKKEEKKEKAEEESKDTTIAVVSQPYPQPSASLWQTRPMSMWQTSSVSHPETGSTTSSKGPAIMLTSPTKFMPRSSTSSRS